VPKTANKLLLQHAFS